MIKTEIYEKTLFETIKRGATKISPDVKNPVICICGCCKTPYIVSTDNPIEVCPCCGNGGVEEEF